MYGNGRDSCPEDDYDARVIDGASDRSIGGWGAKFARRRSDNDGGYGPAREADDFCSGDDSSSSTGQAWLGLPPGGSSSGIPPAQSGEFGHFIPRLEYNIDAGEIVEWKPPSTSVGHKVLGLSLPLRMLRTGLEWP